MRRSKSNVMHPIGIVLALIGLINSVAPASYPSSVTARAASAASAPRLTLSKSTQDGAQPKNHTPEQQGRIAFASDRDDNFEIYVMDPDGGGQTRLTNNTAEDISPAWSPDGTRLAFVSFRDGNAEIYVMSATGGGATRLTTNAAADLDPEWSPDGTRIAFTSGRSGNDDIYVMNADGGNQINLSNNLEGDDLQPTWSPSSQSLAFASNRNGNFEIYVMSADGSNQRNFTNNPADDTNPTWSPMRITFQSDRDGNDEIYAMNGGDGSGQVRLTNNAAPDITPSRAFNNALGILFASARDGNFEIYAARADGSGQTRLTNNGEASDLEPAAQPLAATQAQSSIQFSAATYTVSEATGSSTTVTVTRTGDTSGSAVVDLEATSGTASSRTDFNAVFITLRFAPGETSKSATILITDDAFLEGDETINLTLSNPTGATLGTPSSAILTITDNDTATGATNQIDERDFFVRQQYRDFLNRDPDAPGFAFWTGEYDRRVNACNTTPAGQRTGCVASARASISLAFFLSVEFQQTGYLVYRTYDVAFARIGTPRPARGQPVSQIAIQSDEFLFDTATIARGIVVNNAIDRNVLEANTQAYFREFVRRPAFTARFPESQSRDEYINALFTSAGITPTTAERDAAVAAYGGGGTEGRAAALRNVAENDQVFQREFNRAFVLMQYIGYLRRDPDIAGYNFWLNKMDGTSTTTRMDPANVPNDAEAIGRVRRSEMIEAFIRSCEYQRRFGAPTTSPDDRPVGTACGS